MKCEKCGKNEATVKYIEIINGKKAQQSLCKSCADKSGNIFSEPELFDFGFDSFFQSFLNSPGLSKAPSSAYALCKGCGSSIADIQKSGRLGCSQCYRTFKEHLLRPLKEIHGSNRHTGKIPKRSGYRLKAETEVEGLKAELGRAVADQNFEKAAQLRDKIREIENNQERSV